MSESDTHTHTHTRARARAHAHTQTHTHAHTMEDGNYESDGQGVRERQCKKAGKENNEREKRPAVVSTLNPAPALS